MKRNTLMILLVVLVLALIIPGALAQTFPTGGVSGIQVVNLAADAAVVSSVYRSNHLIPNDLNHS